MRLKNKNVVVFLLSVVIMCLISSLIFFKSTEWRVNRLLDNQLDELIENTNHDNEDKNYSEGKSNENLDVVNNILLLGIDEEENASDTIMILSLNKNDKSIKLVSIMRDTYVYQGEDKANKINYAYHYEGVDGSINTINNVFNLDISKYVKVEFNDLIKLVDYLGGVEVNINEKEREYINTFCQGASLNQCGNVTLNGKQTLSFSRIRAIDSDFERTERQRKVIFGIINKIRSVKVYKYPEIIYELTDVSETNLSILELLEYSSIFLSYDDYSLSQFRIPIDGTWRDNTEGV